jgi:hypothetical protein
MGLELPAKKAGLSYKALAREKQRALFPLQNLGLRENRHQMKTPVTCPFKCAKHVGNCTVFAFNPSDNY